MPVEELKHSRSKNKIEQSQGFDDKEVQNLSTNVSEAINGDQEFIEAMGHVSERVRESLKEDSNSQGGSKKRRKVKRRKKLDPVQIKAQLLKNIPSTTRMQKEIIKEIQKEIKYLYKKTSVINRKKMNYFEMANVVKKIRELKGLLRTLLDVSVDRLKTLWLRFVHGLM